MAFLKKITQYLFLKNFLFFNKTTPKSEKFRKNMFLFCGKYLPFPGYLCNSHFILIDAPSLSFLWLGGHPSWVAEIFLPCEYKKLQIHSFNFFSIDNFFPFLHKTPFKKLLCHTLNGLCLSVHYNIQCGVFLH